MSLYRFSPDSPISSITFRYANDEPTAALIEASKNAAPGQIAAATKMLREKGMSLIPVTVGERDMLQVGGFLTENTLLEALASQQLVKGEPEITQEASDLPPPPKSKFKTFLEKYSLRLAGALNLIGDFSMHFKGYGEITKKTRIDKETGARIDLTPEERRDSRIGGTYDLIGGGLYTLGGLNSAVFGNSKSNAAPLGERTADFIAHAVNLQANSLKSSKESESFFRRHAADTTLAAYTVGAGVLLTKGMWGYQKLDEKLKTLLATPGVSADSEQVKELQLAQKKNSSLRAYGISSLVFKLLSLFIKEKPKSEEDKPKSDNLIMRGVNWFREKPLRIFGLGSLITDSFYAKYAWDTYKEAKTKNKAWDKKETIFTIITTIAYYASDLLSAMSSKNLIAKPLDEDGERGVIARAAQSIAAQSPEKQEELVTKTAQFLSEQAEMQHGKKSITASLKTHLQHLGSNPWAQRVAEETASALNRTA